MRLFLLARLTVLGPAFLLALLFIGGSPRAQLLSGTFPLETGQVTFPVSSSATGSATCTLDLSTNVLAWNVSYANLSSPITMAHFHVGRPGLNGPIQVDITDHLPSGSATLTSVQAGAVANDRWHVLIHTSLNPFGELRGQVRLSPAAVPIASPWAAGVSSLVLLASGSFLLRRRECRRAAES